MTPSGSITYHLQASVQSEAPSLNVSAKSSRTSSQSGRHPKLLRIHRLHSEVLLEVIAHNDDTTAQPSEIVYSITREEFDDFVRQYLLSPH